MNLSKVDRQDVIDLSYDDPIIHDCIQSWVEGYVTFEEAMTIAVVALYEKNKSHE